jgi:hypothetical protein
MLAFGRRQPDMLDERSPDSHEAHGHAMTAKLEERLRKLNWDDIRDWVDDRTAQRGWQYPFLIDNWH